MPPWSAQAHSATDPGYLPAPKSQRAMKDTSAAWARAASSTLHIASGSAKPDRKVCPNRVQKGRENRAPEWTCVDSPAPQVRLRIQKLKDDARLPGSLSRSSNPKVGGSSPSGRAVPTWSVPDHPVAARTWRHVPERAHPTAADLVPNPAPKRSRSEAAGWCYSGAGAVRSASSSVAIRMLSTSR